MRSLYQRTFVVLTLAAAACLITGKALAQGIGFSSTDISGTFTLPFEVQWGEMTLPAGDYTLHYGPLIRGAQFVEVRGSAKGSPHGYVLPNRQDGNTAAKNGLVCLRNGKTYIVSALELPAIGKTLTFPLPRQVQIMVQRTADGYAAQLAEVRVPVKPRGR